MSNFVRAVSKFSSTTWCFLAVVVAIAVGGANSLIHPPAPTVASAQTYNEPAKKPRGSVDVQVEGVWAQVVDVTCVKENKVVMNCTWTNRTGAPQDLNFMFHAHFYKGGVKVDDKSISGSLDPHGRTSSEITSLQAFDRVVFRSNG